MLQSQQSWLPELSEPVKISEVIKNENYRPEIYCSLYRRRQKRIKNSLQKMLQK